MEHQDWDLVSLLKLCLTQNRRADWDELVDLLQPVVRMGIRRALARFGSSDLTDDLTQDVFLKLCERNFSVLRACKADNRAALQAYVITIAASTVTDYFRFQASLKKGSGKSDVSLQDLEPFLVSDDDPSRDAEHRLFLAQIQRCLETQQERNRTIFWLYHRHGYKPKSIAALPGIGMGSDGVETLLYRLTIAVRDCLRKSGVLKEIHRGEGAGA
jgi:RNA polymerase sigma-70 factor (ECF subfamily)